MTDCLVGLRDLVYIPYLDHVSRYGKTIDEPVANLRMVLWMKHIYIGIKSRQGYSIPSFSLTFTVFV